LGLAAHVRVPIRQHRQHRDRFNKKKKRKKDWVERVKQCSGKRRSGEAVDDVAIVTNEEVNEFTVAETGDRISLHDQSIIGSLFHAFPHNGETAAFPDASLFATIALILSY